MNPQGISVTIIRPELTAEERERRMEEIRKAVAALCAATERAKGGKQ